MAVINGDYVTLTVDELTRLMQKNTAKFLLEENKISKNKLTQRQIAEKSGCGLGTVNRISQSLDKNENFSALDLLEAKRGVTIRYYNVIPDGAWEEASCIIHNNTPVDCGLDYSSWSAEAIQKLLEIMSVHVSIKYLYKFLNKINFTSKVATRVNPKRDDAKVEEFKKNKIVEIILQCLLGGMIFVCLDEASAKKSNHVMSYAQKGKRSVAASSTELTHSVATTISFIGFDMNFNIFVRTFTIKDYFNIDEMIKILKILKKENPGKKFFILTDNLSVHKSKRLKSWLKRKNGGNNFATIDYIPEYCPELNPVEFLNNVIKQQLKKKGTMTREGLRKCVEEICAHYNANTSDVQDEIMSFFMSDSCDYILSGLEKAIEQYKNLMGENGACVRAAS